MGRGALRPLPSTQRHSQRTERVASSRPATQAGDRNVAKVVASGRSTLGLCPQLAIWSAAFWSSQRPPPPRSTAHGCAVSASPRPSQDVCGVAWRSRNWPTEGDKPTGCWFSGQARALLTCNNRSNDGVALFSRGRCGAGLENEFDINWEMQAEAAFVMDRIKTNKSGKIWRCHQAGLDPETIRVVLGMKAPIHQYVGTAEWMMAGKQVAEHLPWRDTPQADQGGCESEAARRSFLRMLGPFA